MLHLIGFQFQVGLARFVADAKLGSYIEDFQVRQPRLAIGRTSEEYSNP